MAELLSRHLQRKLHFNIHFLFNLHTHFRYLRYVFLNSFVCLLVCFAPTLFLLFFTITLNEIVDRQTNRQTDRHMNVCFKQENYFFLLFKWPGNEMNEWIEKHEWMNAWLKEGHCHDTYCGFKRTSHVKTCHIPTAEKNNQCHIMSKRKKKNYKRFPLLFLYFYFLFFFLFLQTVPPWDITFQMFECWAVWARA